MKELSARLTLDIVTPYVFGKEATPERCPYLAELLSMDRLSKDYISLLSETYSFSAGQDLVHIVAGALDANGAFKAPEGAADTAERLKMLEILGKIRAAFDKQRLIALARYHRLTAELGAISDALEAGGIDFIPLKGSVIREHYPDPRVRTSCDIDILVRKEDLDAANTVLVDRLGLTREKKNAHDISYYTKSGVHLELHFELIESFNNRYVAKTLENVFELSYVKQGCKHHRMLTDGAYYFYHIAHMAKHLINGGLGIRALMDIAVMLNTEFINVADADDMLKSGELSKFSDACIALTRAWFFGEGHTDVTQRLEAKAMGLTIYGTRETFATMQGAKQGGKLKYLLSRIFYSYEKLCNVYPALEGHRWKTPFYQVKRWSNLIFKKGRMRNSINEVRKLKSIDSKSLDESERLIYDLGLDKT